MFNYFYTFHDRRLATGLYSKYDEFGTPPPPPPGVADLLLLDGEVFLLLDGESFNLLGT